MARRHIVRGENCYQNCADVLFLIASTQNLPQQFSHYRPIRGDGNCGWRGEPDPVFLLAALQLRALCHPLSDRDMVSPVLQLQHTSRAEDANAQTVNHWHTETSQYCACAWIVPSCFAHSPSH